MSVPEELREVLAEGRGVREVGGGVFSVMSEGGAQMYDGRAGLYDALVGTGVYNRLMWGSSPRAYREFARSAFASGAGGRVLDAACGSLLFTAGAYRESSRAVVAFDQSLSMLGRARRRLERAAGRVPPNVYFVQADARDIPFRARAFETVLSMNVLHHLSDAAAFLGRLDALAASGGQLHFTSLITNGRAVGDRYLGALHRAGQLARPRTADELRSLIAGACGPAVSFRAEGNMAFAVARASAGG
ncbi:MAG TPA: class I SAM-dependent methyltransferase [Pyrinomonadaceae bacterium]|nr:class I SAM-dependent methyltransferase [Pyrinomonadaceae bacterium]